MRKTKIITSIDSENISSLNEVDAVCFKMGYVSYNFCKSIIDKIKKELKLSISIGFELEGPSVKTLEFSKGIARFKTGDKIRIYDKKVLGDKTKLSLNYNITNDMHVNSIIKLSEGKVILKVLEKGIDYLICEVINGGYVKNYTKVYLPKITRDFLTEKDKNDIIFGNKCNIDFVIASKVYDENDILTINDLLLSLNNNHINIISSLENDISYKNIDKIIGLSDGVLINQKELSISTDIKNYMLIVDKVIEKCRLASKLSIVSLSKINDYDFFKASNLNHIISASSDAIMYSGNLNISSFVQNIENITNYQNFFDKSINDVEEFIIKSSVLASYNLKIKAIITDNLFMAQKISNMRPNCLIMVLTSNINMIYEFKLKYGVIPILTTNINKAFSNTKNILTKKDKIIIVTSNYIKIREM